MKVPSLYLSIILLAVDKNGKESEAHHSSAIGCWQCCQELERHFGIKTVPSTIYNGKKKFIPSKFPYGKTKEYYLTYLNWGLNFTPEERAQFFDDEPDKTKFSENNPFVDIKIIVKK